MSAGRSTPAENQRSRRAGYDLHLRGTASPYGSRRNGRHNPVACTQFSGAPGAAVAGGKEGPYPSRRPSFLPPAKKHMTHTTIHLGIHSHKRAKNKVNRRELPVSY